MQCKRLNLTFNFQVFIRHLSGTFYESFKIPDGFAIPPEGIYERFSRELALKIACNAGNEECLKDTADRVRLFVIDEKIIPKGLESVIFCSGFRGVGKRTEWIATWQKMQSTESLTLKSQLIDGLGCTDDASLLKDYLATSIGSPSSAKYTIAERRAVLSAVLNSYSGLEAVIGFIDEFELDIIAEYGFESLEQLLEVPAQTIKTYAQRQLFVNFLLTLSHLDIYALTDLIEIADNNIRLQDEPEGVVYLDNIRRIIRNLDLDTTTELATTPTSTQSTSSTTQSVTSSLSTTQSSTESTTTEESTTAGGPSNVPKIFTFITILFFSVFCRARNRFCIKL